MTTGKYLAVMLSVASADVCWTKYMQGVAAGRRLNAAFWSAAIIAVGSVSILAYVSDPAYLVPACVGAFIGTFFSVSPKE